MSEIKNDRLGPHGKVQQFEELGFKGLRCRSVKVIGKEVE